MITDWTVTSGRGGGASGGPIIASGSEYIINTGKEEITYYFAGIGLGVGGPASVTWTDSNTPSISGKLITSGYGRVPDKRLLTISTNGLIMSAGTAPRHFVPVLDSDPVNDIAGGYVLILMFGVTDSVTAIASYMADHAVGKPNGGFFSGAYAYAEVATAAKGVDLGGAGIMLGQWVAKW